MVVDVGCGNGNLVVCLREAFGKATIVGVDLTEESLTGARQRFQQEPNVRFQVGSLTALPFSNGTVNLVTCTEVLEHTFPDVFAHSFAEVSRVYKVGGYYLASVPFNESAYFVCCPGCHEVFAPIRRMNFEITHDDIRNRLTAAGLELSRVFRPGGSESQSIGRDGHAEACIQSRSCSGSSRPWRRVCSPRRASPDFSRGRCQNCRPATPVDHMLSRPFACGRAGSRYRPVAAGALWRRASARRWFCR